jgi:bifunctional non-homologous end joining protein LigD
MGLEGVVMNKNENIYRHGFRSPDWIKVPIRAREEFVVVAGYVPTPHGFSTLIFGQHDGEGKFVYVRFCGTGLSDDTCAVLRNGALNGLGPQKRPGLLRRSSLSQRRGPF